MTVSSFDSSIRRMDCFDLLSQMGRGIGDQSKWASNSRRSAGAAEIEARKVTEVATRNILSAPVTLDESCLAAAERYEMSKSNQVNDGHVFR